MVPLEEGLEQRGDKMHLIFLIDYKMSSITLTYTKGSVKYQHTLNLDILLHRRFCIDQHILQVANLHLDC